MAEAPLAGDVLAGPGYVQLADDDPGAATAAAAAGGVDDADGLPAGEVGGMEGMVALSMVAPDMPPLVERLEGAGAATLRGAGEITVEPQSSHGVHLHISRYHFP